jgi:hypothetical protein
VIHFLHGWTFSCQGEHNGIIELVMDAWEPKEEDEDGDGGEDE